MTRWPGFEALAPFFRMVDEGLDDLVDGEHFFDKLADDAVFEYVVTVPGYPRRVEGRGAVVDLYRNYGDTLILDSADDLAVHRDRDAGVVVLEYAVHGRAVRTGHAYSNRFVSVVAIKDRKITHWRDYLDPTAVFEAIGWPARVGQTFRSTGDLEARVRRLEDRALISDTVTKYAVAVDRRDWAMFADCFTDPVHADYSENGLPAADFTRDDLVAIVRDAVGGYTATQHLSPNHIIEFDDHDPDRAICTSYMYAQHHVDATDKSEFLLLRGSYTHHMVRTNYGWRIERLIQHISWRDARGP